MQYLLFWVSASGLFCLNSIISCSINFPLLYTISFVLMANQNPMTHAYPPFIRLMIDKETGSTTWPLGHVQQQMYKYLCGALTLSPGVYTQAGSWIMWWLLLQFSEDTPYSFPSLCSHQRHVIVLFPHLCQCFLSLFSVKVVLVGGMASQHSFNLCFSGICDFSVG